MWCRKLLSAAGEPQDASRVVSLPGAAFAFTPRTAFARSGGVCVAYLGTPVVNDAEVRSLYKLNPHPAGSPQARTARGARGFEGLKGELIDDDATRFSSHPSFFSPLALPASQCGASLLIDLYERGFYDSDGDNSDQPSTALALLDASYSLILVDAPRRRLLVARSDASAPVLWWSTAFDGSLCASPLSPASDRSSTVVQTVLQTF